jgi:hypothetical protein
LHDDFSAHLSFSAQMGFSDHPLSVIHLSVCELLHFQFLFQNHWVDFNQNWHKLSLEGGWIQVCSNEGQHPSPRGDNTARVKIH